MRGRELCATLPAKTIPRSRAAVAREVHSLEVAGSNPASATTPYCAPPAGRHRVSTMWSATQTPPAFFDKSNFGCARQIRSKLQFALAGTKSQTTISMAKEAIISTSRLNCYGTRVLTEGIDLEQYRKNPVLLFMHRRGRKEDMPIGVIENLRVEGDTLYGTPKFDEDSDEERTIARKWDRGSLRMLSAGLDIVEWSEDPEVLVAGQTRPTITKSKLTEVSVVDIGANDDALQVGLYHEGQLLTLAAGENPDFLPLLKQNETTNEPETEQSQENKMEKILLKLGLAKDATEDDAVAAIGRLQDERSAATLARITDTVESAIKEKRLDASKKEKYIILGKNVGLDTLKELLDDMTPAQKPLDLVKPAGGKSAHTELAWDKMSAEDLEDLRENDREEYIRLFKEHYGYAPTF